MATLKNIIIYCLFATAILAAPTAVEETSPSSRLVRRKNTNKCEAHMHIDGKANSLLIGQFQKTNLVHTASNVLCGGSCTSKYNINLLDTQQPAQPMGYDFNWQKVGTWSTTNPNYRIKIKTTKGLELWIDGKILPGGIYTDDWRRTFTLHYGSQHWNSHECENWLYKSARASNGYRHEFDLWCEFDC